MDIEKLYLELLEDEQLEPIVGHHVLRIAIIDKIKKGEYTQEQLLDHEVLIKVLNKEQTMLENEMYKSDSYKIFNTAGLGLNFILDKKDWDQD